MSITEAGVSGNGSRRVSQHPRLPGSLSLTFGARGGRRQPLQHDDGNKVRENTE